MRNILDEDELHMITVLLKEVRLQVRCGKTMGEQLTTSIGVPQGDCLSPVLFTLYLAKALEDQRRHEDHTYTEIPQLQDHNYNTKNDHTITIDQQYADDVGWITNRQYISQAIKKTAPKKLKKRNLQVNETKTETYTVKRVGPDDWKKCKYLGSLLDSAEDIKRRKQLARSPFIHHKHTLTSSKPTMKIRK